MDGWNTTFLLGFGLFSGAFAVSFREGKSLRFSRLCSIQVGCNDHPGWMQHTERYNTPRASQPLPTGHISGFRIHSWLSWGNCRRGVRYRGVLYRSWNNLVSQIAGIFFLNCNL